MPVENFFIDTSRGRLFCLFYHPIHNSCPSQSIVMVPPFAEEMNKTRKAFTYFAQNCCKKNIGVLLVDLVGTGESDGEFGEATWETWKANVLEVYSWLINNGSSLISALGLRLGALLIIDAFSTSKYELDKIILWQPVVTANVFLKQLLRINLAANLFANSSNNVDKSLPNEMFASNERIEVAGYELSKQLYAAMQQLSLKSLDSPLCKQIIWLETSINVDLQISPAKHKILDNWSKQGNLNTNIYITQDAPFWSTQEIVIPKNLINKTLELA